MQGVKISRAGRIFALTTPSYSRGSHNGRSRKTKEERRIMIVSFVEKFKASNNGDFPPVTLTVKEVGGSFYTVREILQELKQQNISYDNLRTDLKVMETKNQTTIHTVQPLSLPAEIADNGVIDNNHILEPKETKYQEPLSDTGEKKNLIHNDVMETFGLNDQTQAKQEIEIVESPLGTSAASFVVDSQPLQEFTKGHSMSSVSNGVIENNDYLELSRALSDPEEQKNIIHNDVIETCSPHDQTQAKQEIKIIERPLGTSAASVVMDLQVTKGQSISGGSAIVRDDNHSLELKKAEYREVLSDTKEQKHIIYNDIMASCGQTQPEQEIKIVERPPGTSSVSVVGVQPLQEASKGQSISSVSGGFVDGNHSLELNEAKYQESLLDTEEQTSIIHNDIVETCGPNDQSRQTQVKQERTNIERPLLTSAASNAMGLQPLQEVTKEQSLEKEVKNQTRNFIFDEKQTNKNTLEIEILSQISETKDVTIRNVMESYSSSVENVKYEASEVSGKECNLTNDTKSSTSISLDVCLSELQSSELGSHSLENKNLLGSLKEMEHSLPTLSENGSTFGTQKLSSPYSPLEKNSRYIQSSEGGEEHLPLDASKPLSLASDSHSTTFVSESSKDVCYSAYHEKENALAPNSTKRMPEEHESSAGKIISSMTDLVSAKGKANDISDNISEDQKLARLNITPDQELTGFQVAKKVSSEFKSENSDGYTSSKHCIDLTDKKKSASLAANPPLDQGGSIGDMMQTTQTNSDGYRTNNSEKIGSHQDQGESIGDITQSSQNNFSHGNCTDILENKIRTYTNTEGSKDPKKLETNIILDFFYNIIKGIFYLLKKQAKKDPGK